MNRGTIVRNDVIYGPKSNDVSYESKIEEGTSVGTLTINGVDKDIIVPESGSGSEFVELTQAEYDALPDSKLEDDVPYIVTDTDDFDAYVMPYKNTTVGAKLDQTMNFVRLTKAEYEALPDSKLTDGVCYFITDEKDMDAYNVPYKNTTVGDELDAQKQNIADLQGKVLKEYHFQVTTDGSTGFVTTSLSTSKKIVGIDVEQAGYFAMHWKSSSGVYGITAIRNDMVLGKNVTISGTMYYFD